MAKVNSDYFSYNGILQLGPLSGPGNQNTEGTPAQVSFAAAVDEIRSNPQLWQLFTSLNYGNLQFQPTNRTAPTSLGPGTVASTAQYSGAFPPAGQTQFFSVGPGSKQVNGNYLVETIFHELGLFQGGITSSNNLTAALNGEAKGLYYELEALQIINPNGSVVVNGQQVSLNSFLDNGKVSQIWLIMQ